MITRKEISLNKSPDSLWTIQCTGNNTSSVAEGSKVSAELYASVFVPQIDVLIIRLNNNNNNNIYFVL